MSEEPVAYIFKALFFPEDTAESSFKQSGRQQIWHSRENLDSQTTNQLAGQPANKQNKEPSLLKSQQSSTTQEIPAFYGTQIFITLS